MNISKPILSVFLGVAISVISLSVNATYLSVTNAVVTKVQTYESSNDAVNVWIHLNGNSRIGPNPKNTSNTCELWTNNRTVYSTALAALMSGKKVDISYEDRGEGTYWCKVRNFSVNSDFIL